MKLNPLALKSLTRSIVVGTTWIVTALNTYLAAGHTFGLNRATLVGVGIQLLIALLALLERYLDKNDPAFGKVAAPVIAGLVAKLAPGSKPAA